MNNIIEIKNLNMSYGKKEVLKNLNLNIDSGKIIGILGPNASGKSTLIKIINGLLKPDSGDVTIYGNKPGIETKKIISYLPERTYISDWMKVKNIISYFEDFFDDFDTEKVHHILKDFDIDINSKVENLSKGTK